MAVSDKRSSHLRKGMISWKGLDKTHVRQYNFETLLSIFRSSMTNSIRETISLYLSQKQTALRLGTCYQSCKFWSYYLINVGQALNTPHTCDPRLARGGV